MKTKKCFNCKKIKAISHFYKHKAMTDGYLGKCKECTKKDVRKNRRAKIDYYQAYDRKRADLPKRKKLRKALAERYRNDPKLWKIACELRRKWAKKNIIKRAAHIITGNAIRSGKLIPELCSVCGKKKVDAHHEDYTKPLEVIWLCKKHHAELHKRKREEERNKK